MAAGLPMVGIAGMAEMAVGVGLKRGIAFAYYLC
jgi:hypothetical protein